MLASQVLGLHSGGLQPSLSKGCMHLEREDAAFQPMANEVFLPYPASVPYPASLVPDSMLDLWKTMGHTATLQTRNNISDAGRRHRPGACQVLNLLQALR